MRPHDVLRVSVRRPCVRGAALSGPLTVRAALHAPGSPSCDDVLNRLTEDAVAELDEYSSTPSILRFELPGGPAGVPASVELRAVIFDAVGVAVCLVTVSVSLATGSTAKTRDERDWLVYPFEPSFFAAGVNLAPSCADQLGDVAGTMQLGAVWQLGGAPAPQHEHVTPLLAVRPAELGGGLRRHPQQQLYVSVAGLLGARDAPWLLAAAAAAAGVTGVAAGRAGPTPALAPELSSFAVAVGLSRGGGDLVAEPQPVFQARCCRHHEGFGSVVRSPLRLPSAADDGQGGDWAIESSRAAVFDVPEADAGGDADLHLVFYVLTVPRTAHREGSGGGGGNDQLALLSPPTVASRPQASAFAFLRLFDSSSSGSGGPPQSSSSAGGIGEAPRGASLCSYAHNHAAHGTRQPLRAPAVGSDARSRDSLRLAAQAGVSFASADVQLYPGSPAFLPAAPDGGPLFLPSAVTRAIQADTLAASRGEASSLPTHLRLLSPVPGSDLAVASTVDASSSGVRRGAAPTSWLVSGDVGSAQGLGLFPLALRVTAAMRDSALAIESVSDPAVWLLAAASQHQQLQLAQHQSPRTPSLPAAVLPVLRALTSSAEASYRSGAGFELRHELGAAAHDFWCFSGVDALRAHQPCIVGLVQGFIAAAAPVLAAAAAASPTSTADRQSSISALSPDALSPASLFPLSGHPATVDPALLPLPAGVLAAVVKAEAAGSAAGPEGPAAHPSASSPIELVAAAVRGLAQVLAPIGDLLCEQQGVERAVLPAALSSALESIFGSSSSSDENVGPGSNKAAGLPTRIYVAGILPPGVLASVLGACRLHSASALARLAQALTADETVPRLSVLALQRWLKAWVSVASLALAHISATGQLFGVWSDDGTVFDAWAAGASALDEAGGLEGRFAPFPEDPARHVAAHALEALGAVSQAASLASALAAKTQPAQSNAAAADDVAAWAVRLLPGLLSWLARAGVVPESAAGRLADAAFSVALSCGSADVSITSALAPAPQVASETDSYGPTWALTRASATGSDIRRAIDRYRSDPAASTLKRLEDFHRLPPHLQRLQQRSSLLVAPLAAGGTSRASSDPAVGDNAVIVATAVPPASPYFTVHKPLPVPRNPYEAARFDMEQGSPYTRTASTSTAVALSALRAESVAMSRAFDATSGAALGSTLLQRVTTHPFFAVAAGSGSPFPTIAIAAEGELPSNNKTASLASHTAWVFQVAALSAACTATKTCIPPLDSAARAAWGRTLMLWASRTTVALLPAMPMEEERAASHEPSLAAWSCVWHSVANALFLSRELLAGPSVVETGDIENVPAAAEEVLARLLDLAEACGTEPRGSQSYQQLRCLVPVLLAQVDFLNRVCGRALTSDLSLPGRLLQLSAVLSVAHESSGAQDATAGAGALLEIPNAWRLVGLCASAAVSAAVVTGGTPGDESAAARALVFCTQGGQAQRPAHGGAAAALLAAAVRKLDSASPAPDLRFRDLGRDVRPVVSSLAAVGRLMLGVAADDDALLPLCACRPVLAVFSLACRAAVEFVANFTESDASVCCDAVVSVLQYAIGVSRAAVQRHCDRQDLRQDPAQLASQLPGLTAGVADAMQLVLLSAVAVEAAIVSHLAEGSAQQVPSAVSRTLAAAVLDSVVTAVPILRRGSGSAGQSTDRWAAGIAAQATLLSAVDSSLRAATVSGTGTSRAVALRRVASAAATVRDWFGDLVIPAASGALQQQSTAAAPPPAPSPQLPWTADALRSILALAEATAHADAGLMLCDALTSLYAFPAPAVSLEPVEYTCAAHVLAVKRRLLLPRWRSALAAATEVGGDESLRQLLVCLLALEKACADGFLAAALSCERQLAASAVGTLSRAYVAAVEVSGAASSVVSSVDAAVSSPASRAAKARARALAGRSQPPGGRLESASGALATPSPLVRPLQHHLASVAHPTARALSFPPQPLQVEESRTFARTIRAAPPPSSVAPAAQSAPALPPTPPPPRGSKRLETPRAAEPLLPAHRAGPRQPFSVGAVQDVVAAVTGRARFCFLAKLVLAAAATQPALSSKVGTAEEEGGDDGGLTPPDTPTFSGAAAAAGPGGVPPPPLLAAVPPTVVEALLKSVASVGAEEEAGPLAAALRAFAVACSQGMAPGVQPVYVAVGGIGPSFGGGSYDPVWRIARLPMASTVDALLDRLSAAYPGAMVVAPDAGLVFARPAPAAGDSPDDAISGAAADDGIAPPPGSTGSSGTVTVGGLALAGTGPVLADVMQGLAALRCSRRGGPAALPTLSLASAAPSGGGPTKDVLYVTQVYPQGVVSAPAPASAATAAKAPRVWPPQLSGAPEETLSSVAAAHAAAAWPALVSPHLSPPPDARGARSASASVPVMGFRGWLARVATLDMHAGTARGDDPTAPQQQQRQEPGAGGSVAAHLGPPPVAVSEHAVSTAGSGTPVLLAGKFVVSKHDPDRLVAAAEGSAVVRMDLIVSPDALVEWGALPPALLPAAPPTASGPGGVEEDDAEAEEYGGGASVQPDSPSAQLPGAWVSRSCPVATVSYMPVSPAVAALGWTTAAQGLLDSRLRWLYRVSLLSEEGGEVVDAAAVAAAAAEASLLSSKALVGPAGEAHHLDSEGSSRQLALLSLKDEKAALAIAEATLARTPVFDEGPPVSKGESLRTATVALAVSSAALATARLLSSASAAAEVGALGVALIDSSRDSPPRGRVLLSHSLLVHPAALPQLLLPEPVAPRQQQQQQHAPAPSARSVHWLPSPQPGSRAAAGRFHSPAPASFSWPRRNSRQQLLLQQYARTQSSASGDGNASFGRYSDGGDEFDLSSGAEDVGDEYDDDDDAQSVGSRSTDRRRHEVASARARAAAADFAGETPTATLDAVPELELTVSPVHRRHRGTTNVSAAGVAADLQQPPSSAAVSSPAPSPAPLSSLRRMASQRLNIGAAAALVQQQQQQQAAEDPDGGAAGDAEDALGALRGGFSVPGSPSARASMRLPLYGSAASPSPPDALATPSRASSSPASSHASPHDALHLASSTARTRASTSTPSGGGGLGGPRRSALQPSMSARRLTAPALSAATFAAPTSGAAASGGLGVVSGAAALLSPTLLAAKTWAAAHFVAGGLHAPAGGGGVHKRPSLEEVLSRPMPDPYAHRGPGGHVAVQVSLGDYKPALDVAALAESAQVKAAVRRRKLLRDAESSVVVPTHHQQQRGAAFEAAQAELAWHCADAADAPVAVLVPLEHASAVLYAAGIAVLSPVWSAAAGVSVGRCVLRDYSELRVSWRERTVTEMRRQWIREDAAQAAAGIDTSNSVMPDFSVVLARPPHPLIGRLEGAVAGLLSTGSEVASLHGEMARLAAARASAAASAAGDGEEVAGVVGSRDSVLSDGLNAVFCGLTML